MAEMRTATRTSAICKDLVGTDVPLKKQKALLFSRNLNLQLGGGGRKAEPDTNHSYCILVSFSYYPASL